MSRYLLVLLVLVATSSLAEDKKSVSESVHKIGNPAPADAPAKDVDVTAKKYEFSPATIEVPAHTLLRLHLKALDKGHGFELKSIRDSCVKFDPENPTVVEFYAENSGELEFSCCKFCGLGHSKMKGKLIVK